VAVVLLLLGATVDEAVLRSLSLLVAASPCALAISTPSAVLSAVARAARGGVLMKGGAHLEALGKARIIAFDKTGTLTVGKPRLVTASAAAGVAEERLLAVAAGAEALSGHPIARAVVEAAKARGVDALPASEMEAVHGQGLRAVVGGQPVAIGSLDLFEGDVPEALRADVARLQAAGQTTMLVRQGGAFLGVLGVADTARPEAPTAMRALRGLGIEQTLMLSGDNATVARAVAGQLGIDDVRAPLMPEGKVHALRTLARDAGVAMVGDGVNDAPALAAASVGIAMGGAGSDVALETADVVLMGDDLRSLPFAVSLARASNAVVRQNLLIALGVSGVLVLASLFGWVRIAEAVVLHEGSTLLVVFNGLRLLAYRAPDLGGA
jgi:Cd2+/Zn2+-exporting ATPase